MIRFFSLVATSAFSIFFSLLDIFSVSSFVFFSRFLLIFSLFCQFCSILFDFACYSSQLFFSLVNSAFYLFPAIFSLFGSVQLFLLFLTLQFSSSQLFISLYLSNLALRSYFFPYFTGFFKSFAVYSCCSSDFSLSLFFKPFHLHGSKLHSIKTIIIQTTSNYNNNWCEKRILVSIIGLG